MKGYFTRGHPRIDHAENYFLSKLYYFQMAIRISTLGLLMKPNKHNTEKHYYETGRLMAFSDGVFSIAITLLVLLLIEMLHSADEHDLVHQLSNNWESFLAFAVGFLTILICWINHHLVFTYIKRA